jgi:hypothetical protein
MVVARIPAANVHAKRTFDFIPFPFDSFGMTMGREMLADWRESLFKMGSFCGATC